MRFAYDRPLLNIMFFVDINDQGDYIKYRAKFSNVAKYTSGENLNVEDADNVMAQLSVVNTLILTIPYGIIGNLNYEYFDWLQETIEDCDNMDWETLAWNMVAPLYTTVTASVLAVVLTVLYYMFRPKNIFRTWWHYRGKYSVGFTMLLTVIATLSTLTLFASLMGWYSSATSELCVTQAINFRRYVGIYTLTALFFVVFFFLMI